MFFAVPKVKSLSRYSEYGLYLGSGFFLSMLLAAVLLHLAIIALLSMTPHQKVVRIPVHALNIKLSGGNSANGIHREPAASLPPAVPSVPEKEQATPAESELKPLPAENAEAAVDKAIKQVKPAKNVRKNTTVPGGTGKVVREVKKSEPNQAVEITMATPKQYVRESAVPTGKLPTPGGDITATATATPEAKGDTPGGKEFIRRYTQTVSQLIKNHKAYALAFYDQAIQASGKVQGQAVIRLLINRDGSIVSSGVEHSSGNELVDKIAIAMVRASDPLPAVPSDYSSDSRLAFLIAVQVEPNKQ